MLNKSSRIYEGEMLDVYRKGNREYMVRKSCTGVVVIIAVNDEGELILTEQYRTSVDKRVLELPAGLVADTSERKNETLEEAAKRELLEETGYEALAIRQIAEGPISSGISNEVITFFYAEHLIKKHEGGGDSSENITVNKTSLQDAERFIAQKMAENKLLIDPKLYIGLYFARKYAKVAH
jgi:ADP-ribose pyrophosphatase